MAWLYILRGSTGRHYIGSTTNLERRLSEHRSGGTHTTQRLGEQPALTKIYRQQIPGLREGIEDLSKGRTAQGFDKLDKLGAIQEIPDDAGRLAAIAEIKLRP
jgi:hypothetical protein